MTIGERCATLSIKKYLLIFSIFIFTILIIVCAVGCIPQYKIREISHFVRQAPLRTLVIRSSEELEKYFSQDDYIEKGDNYEEDISGFTKEYFDEKVLIPILYSKENYIFKSVKIENNKVIVSLMQKSGNRPTIMPTLCFLELNKKFVGDATESEVIYTK